VTDRIALILGALIVALIGLDVIFNSAEGLLFLGRKFAVLIDFLTFWN